MESKTVQMGATKRGKKENNSDKLSYDQLEELVNQYYNKANQLQQALAQSQTDTLNQALYASLEILKINNDKVEQLQEDASKLAMFLFSKIEGSIYGFFTENKEDQSQQDPDNDLMEE